MAQHPIEIILLRQWASYIATPIWIYDEESTLVYYNEPAEGIIGMRFNEVGEISADRLADLFVTTGKDGEPIPNEELPIVIALTKRVPAHREFRIRAFDGSWRDIAATGLPLEGQGGRLLGAVSAFWETGDG